MRGLDQRRGVSQQVGGGWELAHQARHLHDGGSVEHRLGLGLLPGRGPLEDLHHVIGGGERNQRLEQEAVELGLRQRIGPFLFDRVLGRHHQKGPGQGMGLAAEGDPLLLHRLEQGRLGLRGGAVDLVGQDQVGEDRAFVELEVVADQHLGAEDVGRHQVGSELDPPELDIEHPAQGRQELGLAEARHAFQKHVSFAERGRQHGVDQLALADDHLCRLRPGRLRGAGRIPLGSWFQLREVLADKVLKGGRDDEPVK